MEKHIYVYNTNLDISFNCLYNITSRGFNFERNLVSKQNCDPLSCSLFIRMALFQGKYEQLIFYFILKMVTVKSGARFSQP